MEPLVNRLSPNDEQKLMAAHAKDYHGTDDDMPDAYEAWLMDLEDSEILEIIK